VFLAKFEGIERLTEQSELIKQDKIKISEIKQLLVKININIKEEYKGFFIKFGYINGIKAITILNNQSILYIITKTNIFNEPNILVLNNNLVFIFNDRYSEITFQGIILDTRAAGVSIAGIS
jgi:hypothetical protein